MKKVTGIIDHRILINYRVDPDVMQRVLPEGFEPKLVNGYAIGGICQVSLSQMRPKGLPAGLGTSSHNAAHRIAVKCAQGEGVYVPRRDTNSFLNTLSGGRLFPGAYSKADFDITQSSDHYRLHIENNTSGIILSIEAEICKEISPTSIFKSTDDISTFFKSGNMGWSPNTSTTSSKTYDAIELITEKWNMTPMCASKTYSGFFSNTETFPEGAVEFDSAMIMKNIPHSWVAKDESTLTCC